VKIKDNFVVWCHKYLPVSKWVIVTCATGCTHPIYRKSGLWLGHRKQLIGHCGGIGPSGVNGGADDSLKERRESNGHFWKCCPYIAEQEKMVHLDNWASDTQCQGGSSRNHCRVLTMRNEPMNHREGR
jgi:hypothetical protein